MSSEQPPQPPKARRWKGKAEKFMPGDARIGSRGTGPGPESAATMLCELRADAQAILRSNSTMLQQNAEIVKLLAKIAGQMAESTVHLASIDGRLTEQRDDTENMMVQATDNTNRLIAALNDVAERLRERG